MDFTERKKKKIVLCNAMPAYDPMLCVPKRENVENTSVFNSGQKKSILLPSFPAIHDYFPRLWYYTIYFIFFYPHIVRYIEENVRWVEVGGQWGKYLSEERSSKLKKKKKLGEKNGDWIFIGVCCEWSKSCVCLRQLNFLFLGMCSMLRVKNWRDETRGATLEKKNNLLWKRRRWP